MARLDNSLSGQFYCWQQPFTTETNRVAFLFDRYEALTNALFA